MKAEVRPTDREVSWVNISVRCQSRARQAWKELTSHVDKPCFLTGNEKERERSYGVDKRVRKGVVGEFMWAIAQAA